MPLNIPFKLGNSDADLLKNMASDVDHKYNEDELMKALDKTKLVQKEVEVRGKNGQVHKRKQWVKAGDEQSSDKTPVKQEDEEKQHWTKVGTSDEAKKQICDMLNSGKSRTDLMDEFKAQGVTWKESEHEGINWMRATMAMNKHLTSNTSQKSDAKTDEDKSSKDDSIDQKDPEKKTSPTSDKTSTKSVDDMTSEEIKSTPEYTKLRKACKNDNHAVNVTKTY